MVSIRFVASFCDEGRKGKLIENILTNTKLNKQYKKDNFAKNGNPDSMRERGSFIIRFFFYAMFRKNDKFYS